MTTSIFNQTPSAARPMSDQLPGIHSKTFDIAKGITATGKPLNMIEPMVMDETGDITRATADLMGRVGYLSPVTGLWTAGLGENPEDAMLFILGAGDFNLNVPFGATCGEKIGAFPLRNNICNLLTTNNFDGDIEDFATGDYLTVVNSGVNIGKLKKGVKGVDFIVGQVLHPQPYNRTDGPGGASDFISYYPGLIARSGAGSSSSVSE